MIKIRQLVDRFVSSELMKPKFIKKLDFVQFDPRKFGTNWNLQILLKEILSENWLKY